MCIDDISCVDYRVSNCCHLVDIVIWFDLWFGFEFISCDLICHLPITGSCVVFLLVHVMITVQHCVVSILVLCTMLSIKSNISIALHRFDWNCLLAVIFLSVNSIDMSVYMCMLLMIYRYIKAPNVMTWCRQVTVHEDHSVLSHMLNVCILHIFLVWWNVH